ncbi:hypothetical protein AB0C60_16700, partial [Streptomyces sp. NPDC048845]
MGPMPSNPGRPSGLDPAVAARLKRNADGLVPAVAQQYDTGEVLMLGWMDDTAAIGGVSEDQDEAFTALGLAMLAAVAIVFM